MRKRLIPVLLMDRHQRLVKTVQFEKRTYVGDPFNIVRLFNEREVDEICLIDIDASKDKRKPNFEFLSQFASECFMPLAYGGGISTVQDCQLLNKIGIEKFIIKSHANNDSLIQSLASEFGSQSLIGCIDYDEHLSINNQQINELIEISRKLEDTGFGELILQSTNRDGMRQGYDLATIEAVSKAINVPLIALGGAGYYSHLYPVLNAGASAAASGSAFTFIGKLRAVLVNYPEPGLLEEIAGGF